MGLDVEGIEYSGSQHWAMPESQLMLGCIATATSEDFDLDPVELEGGRWVDAATLFDAVSRAKQLTANPNPSVNTVNKLTGVPSKIFFSSSGVDWDKYVCLTAITCNNFLFERVDE